MDFPGTPTQRWLGVPGKSMVAPYPSRVPARCPPVNPRGHEYLSARSA